MDTIYAVCSGSLPSSVCVLRVSGQLAFSIANQLIKNFEQKQSSSPLFLAKVLNGSDKTEIDEALVLVFKSPNSLTGEDVIEIQCHGSIATVSVIESNLTQLGARKATRGEFIYRAYLNQKINKEKILELADVYQSKTKTDLESIYKRRTHETQRLIEKVRENLLLIQSHICNAIDFSQDYEGLNFNILSLIEESSQILSHLVNQYESFIGRKTTPKLVLAGRPNAGKSTLFNALVGKNRAITSDIEGTTRDVIEESILVNQKEWLLVDTAGVRQTQNEIEKQGIELGKDYIKASERWILVADGTQDELTLEEKDLIRDYSEKLLFILWNKKDHRNWRPSQSGLNQETVSISSNNPSDTEGLFQKIEEKMKQSHIEDTVLPTLNQYHGFKQTLNLLLEAKNRVDKKQPLEYLDEIIRLINKHLNSAMEEISIEDIQKKVFNEFCVGK